MPRVQRKWITDPLPKNMKVRPVPNRYKHGFVLARGCITCAFGPETKPTGQNIQEGLFEVIQPLVQYKNHLVVLSDPFFMINKHRAQNSPITSTPCPFPLPLPDYPFHLPPSSLLLPIPFLFFFTFLLPCSKLPVHIHCRSNHHHPLHNGYHDNHDRDDDGGDDNDADIDHDK